MRCACDRPGFWSAASGRGRERRLADAGPPAAHAAAKSVAEGLAPKLDWTKPKFLPTGDLDPSWAVTHPNNYWVLDDQASDLIELKKWAEAKAPLQKIIDAYPNQTGPASAGMGAPKTGPGPGCNYNCGPAARAAKPKKGPY